jgi:hypothetical protein
MNAVDVIDGAMAAIDRDWCQGRLVSVKDAEGVCYGWGHVSWCWCKDYLAIINFRS